MTRSSVFALTLASALLLPAVARADGANKAAAQELFDQGRKLMEILTLLEESGGRPARNPVFDLVPGESRCYHLVPRHGEETVQFTPANTELSAPARS